MQAVRIYRNNYEKNNEPKQQGKTIVMFAKNKRVKLKGKHLAKLNSDIHQRDGHTCIIKGCDRYVLPGVKFHHEPCGQDKSDEIEKGLLLCNECHFERHFGARSTEIKAECRAYLRELYG